ncbi:MAG: hypothetical protein ACLP5E_15645, partial [Streptosporangiaceae bacterium]
TSDGDADDALPESAHRTTALAYDGTGRHLAAAGTDGAVLIWDAAKAVGCSSSEGTSDLVLCLISG